MTNKLKIQNMIHSSLILLIPLLLLLATALMTDQQDLFYLFNKIADYQPLHFLWLHITHLGEFLVTIALLSILITKWPQLLGPTFVSAIITIASVQGLKHIVDAPRPPEVEPPTHINVVVLAFQDTLITDPDADPEALIDNRPDLIGTWDKIVSNPNSKEARYWIPRMGGLITKNQFGIAYQRETNELDRGTYDGIYYPSSRSFPSGHAATIACAITLILLRIRSRKLMIGLSGVALTVGLSRVIVGVHWPIDVATGGILGWAAALIGSQLIHYIRFSLGNISNYVVALLPIMVGILLLTRQSLYPQVSIFEDVLGVTITIIGANRLYQLSRNA